MHLLAVICLYYWQYTLTTGNVHLLLIIYPCYWQYTFTIYGQYTFITDNMPFLLTIRPYYWQYASISENMPLLPIYINLLLQMLLFFRSEVVKELSIKCIVNCSATSLLSNFHRILWLMSFHMTDALPRDNNTEKNWKLLKVPIF